MADRFPSPFEIETPAGAEGWQELYTYSSLFTEGRREYEDSMFWFQDGVHWPQALRPWDATLYEFAIASLSQYNTRHLQVPPANGIDFRILNGYAYLTPVPAPEADIEARVANFMDRAGFYFMNWDDLYDKWMIKIRDLVKELETIDFDALPELEDADEVVKSGSGVGSGWRIQADYHRLLDLALKLWQYHFEFLNLGYAAYLDFFGFCKQSWPSIPDLAIAKMVAGVEVDLFRPDEELKRLARMAVDTGIADAFAAGDVDATCQVLKGSPAGEAWIASFQESAEPWFNFSTGSGFYHSDKIWIENVGIPFDFIDNYIGKLQNGDDLARPDGGHPRRARPHRQRVRRAAAQRRGPRGVPGQARPGPRRVPVRGEPQLLRRALEPLGHLAQDAPARRALRQGGLLGRGERHLLPQAHRGRGGALGLLRVLGDSGTGGRPRATGRRRSSAVAASTRPCRPGSRRRPWACRRRSSPSRSPSCSGASPPTACRRGSAAARARTAR